MKKQGASAQQMTSVHEKHESFDMSAVEAIGKQDQHMSDKQLSDEMLYEITGGAGIYFPKFPIFSQG